MNKFVKVRGDFYNAGVLLVINVEQIVTVEKEKDKFEFRLSNNQTVRTDKENADIIFKAMGVDPL